MKRSEREASKNHLTERRSVRTAVATISYLEDGPSDGSPVFFLHGFPDDPTGFDQVVDRISNHGLHLIRPFLRGFGPTEVNSPTARSGEAAALGQDLIDLADALGISVLKVVGHDWGSRAGHAAAILAPQRISSLFAISSPFFVNPDLCGRVGTRSRAIRGSASDDRVGCSASDGRCAPARPALHGSTGLLPFLPCALASADGIRPFPLLRVL